MRVTLLHGDVVVAEFGFLRLDAPPPRAVSFDGEVYVIDHPLMMFGEDKTRRVYGWAYRFVPPMLLRPEDRLTPARAEGTKGML